MFKRTAAGTLKFGVKCKATALLNQTFEKNVLEVSAIATIK
jgi:hypothetical protein